MKNIEKLANEIQVAREKYGPFNSTHEVYGVLIEEVQEFFDEVKIKNADPDLFEELPDYVIEDKNLKKSRMINELMQIAAISLRAIDELEHDQIKWV